MDSTDCPSRCLWRRTEAQPGAWLPPGLALVGSRPGLQAQRSQVSHCPLLPVKNIHRLVIVKLLQSHSVRRKKTFSKVLMAPAAGPSGVWFS